MGYFLIDLAELSNMSEFWLSVNDHSLMKCILILAANIPLNEWSVVGVSYQRSTGRGILFLNDQKKDQSGLLSAGTLHNTQSDIRMGAVSVDTRYYRHGYLQLNIRLVVFFNVL